MHTSSLPFGQFKSMWKHHPGFLYTSTWVPAAAWAWAAAPQPRLSRGRAASLWLHSRSNPDSQRLCLRNLGSSSLPYQAGKALKDYMPVSGLARAPRGLSQRACHLRASALFECCCYPGFDLLEQMLWEMGISQSQLQDAKLRAQRPGNRRLQIVAMTFKTAPEVLCSWGCFSEHL